jgi:hypothetical protein
MSATSATFRADVLLESISNSFIARRPPVHRTTGLPSNRSDATLGTATAFQSARPGYRRSGPCAAVFWGECEATERPLRCRATARTAACPRRAGLSRTALGQADIDRCDWIARILLGIVEVVSE